MSKKLWYGLAVFAVSAAVGVSILAHITKPETQEFTRTFTVMEKEIIPEEKYGLITTSPAMYIVTLETEGGNEVKVTPNRNKYVLFPSVGQRVTLTYDTTDAGGRLVTKIKRVKYDN